jgi:hypothetical protein
MHELFESEHTEVLARVVWARKRPSLAWLVVAALLLGGAIAITFLAPPPVDVVERTTVKGIEAIALELGKAVDATATAAHARADKLADTPAMRAGILTDAATMSDVLKDELKVVLAPNEKLEVFQVHDATTASLIRIPSTAAALPTIRDRAVGMVHLDGGGLEVVVGAPIERLKNGAGYENDKSGELVLAVPVDLDPIRQRLADHAKSALLTADGSSQSLLPTTPKGMAIRVHVPSNTAELSLAAVPMATTHRTSWLDPVRYGVAGAGALLVITFLLLFALRKPVPRRY